MIGQHLVNASERYTAVLARQRAICRLEQRRLWCARAVCVALSVIIVFSSCTAVSGDGPSKLSLPYFGEMERDGDGRDALLTASRGAPIVCSTVSWLLGLVVGVVMLSTSSVSGKDERQCSVGSRPSRASCRTAFT